MKLTLAAAVIMLASLGIADAADPVVPTTGSQQGITVPHALPGEPTHRHDPTTEGHLTAPTGQNPQGSESGFNPANAVPGSTVRTGEVQAHADVVSPRGVVPEVGSAQGPNALSSR